MKKTIEKWKEGSKNRVNLLNIFWGLVLRAPHTWLAGKLMIIDSGSNLATSSAAEDKQPPAADL